MVPPIYEANLLVSRLEKLNELVVRSKPLRSWTARTVGDVEVELTTRRTLAFLSGHHRSLASLVSIMTLLMTPRWRRGAAPERYSLS